MSRAGRYIENIESGHDVLAEIREELMEKGHDVPYLDYP